MRAWVAIIVVLAVASGCGRIEFDPQACELSLEPLAGHVNFNSPVTFATTGAQGQIEYRIVSGVATFDDAGVLWTGDQEGRLEVEATDAQGCPASASLVVGGSSLFRAGGQDSASVPVSEVLRSDDGKSWTMIGNLPQPRLYGRLVVFDDRMWWVGGNGPDVWTSRDGVTWDPMASLPSGVYSELAVIAHRGRLFLIGGSNSSGTGNTDAVLATTDGTGWQQIGGIGDPMHGLRCILYAGRMRCLGGHDNTGRIPAVLSSDDGVMWTTEPPLPFLREEQGLAAVGEMIVLAGGDDAAGDVALTHRSPDGVTWIAGGDLPQKRFLADLVPFAGKLYLIGADSTVLSTTDASSWTLEGSLPAYRSGGGTVAFTPP